MAVTLAKLVNVKCPGNDLCAPPIGLILERKPEAGMEGSVGGHKEPSVCRVTGADDGWFCSSVKSSL